LAAPLLALVQVKCKVVLSSLLPPSRLLDSILKTLRERERERERASERERERERERGREGEVIVVYS